MTLDGQVISAPRISGPITTPATEISGSFTQASAAALANSLKFGALPLAFDRAESVNVSAQLGLEYLTAGLIAGGIGLLLVIIYCLLYYRLLGVITILSLILSFGIVYAVLVLLGRWVNYSLDMAGVAGLIIAIGITADSFVIYFERIKDEVREGRTFRSAVPRGWQRAKRTILSADAVSFLSAAILYVLAVGEVKGFAFTLGLSTVLDLVVVFLVTHPLVHLAAGSPLFTSPTWSGLGSVAKAGASQRAENARVGARGGTSDTGHQGHEGGVGMTTDDDAVATKAMADATTADAAAGRPTMDKQYGRQAGFLSRLSTGTGAFNILGHRKVYYAVSGGAGDRLDPADRLPRLPVRHRLRRRHHAAVPAQRGHHDLHHRGRPGGHVGDRGRAGRGADRRQPGPGQLVDAVGRPGHHGEGAP